MTPREIEADLQRQLPSILALTEAAVNTDSGSYDAAGVNAVIDLFAAFLAETGFILRRQPIPGRGDQLTAHKQIGAGPRILVLGHADTVWPSGTVATWKFHNDGTWLTGPGVGDMKSCVVTALHAIRLLLRNGLSGVGAITVLIVPDEEIGSPQSRGWIEAEARTADVCLTLEPCRPEGGVVIGRGAVGALYLRAKGVSAHTGSARAHGASALAALARLVDPLEALSDPARGIGATVGIFHAGAARQVVPDAAELHLDLRAADRAGAEHLLAEALRVANTPPSDRRVTISAEGAFYRPPFPTTDATRLLFDRARRICAELGAPIREIVSPGGSDGSFAAALGVPTLDGLGPITHETCSRRERVELASIVSRGALFGGLIAAFAAEGLPG